MDHTLPSCSRSAPKPVKPLIHNNIEYSASHQIGMGLVQARDLASNQILWTRQAYAVVYIDMLETDVQDTFITKIELHPDQKSLKITNERNQVHSMSL